MKQKNSRGLLLRIATFVLCFSFAASSWGAASDILVGALFGTAYVQSFDTKEIDFYVGQAFYNRDPTNFSYFDTTSITFGTDITLFRQDFFNWFVGTERLGRTGSGPLGGQNLQYDLNVNGLYTGARFDLKDKAFFEPYVFCIGGVYSMSDLLGSDSVILNSNTYNVNGTTLGLELGLGFSPFAFNDVDVGIEGCYRFISFSNVSYSPASLLSPALPAGLPTSIDYSGWSFGVNISFEPPNHEDKVNNKEAAREKLLAGNIPYKKQSFLDAVNNCDTYVVKLFLESGFKLDQEDLTVIRANKDICKDVQDVISSFNDKKD